MIFGWDFCLVYRVVVDMRVGILCFNSGLVFLLSREELVLELGMVWVCDYI